MLPTVILAYISNSTIWGQYSGMNLDYFAPLKYAIGWLMPSAMIAVAIGIFFTELTETAYCNSNTKGCGGLLT